MFSLKCPTCLCLYRATLPILGCSILKAALAKGTVRKSNNKATNSTAVDEQQREECLSPQGEGGKKSFWSGFLVTLFCFCGFVLRLNCCGELRLK